MHRVKQVVWTKFSNVKSTSPLTIIIEGIGSPDELPSWKLLNDDIRPCFDFRPLTNNFDLTKSLIFFDWKSF